MRCLTILLLLAASYTPLHNAPPPANVLHIMEDQFAARYLQWDNFSPNTKAELYNMFNVSKNKHAWFPDHYSKPTKGSAIIRPRGSLHEEYLSKGGQPWDTLKTVWERLEW